MNKNVLLIGRNPTVLAQLDEALTTDGFAVKTTNLVERASQDFNGADFDLVAFGRGVDETTNAQLRSSFLVQNPGILFVDGLAPVISFLVKQINLALSDEQRGKLLTEFTCQQTDCSQVLVTVTRACQLTIDLYELDATHTTNQQRLVSESITAGVHRFSLLVKPASDSGIRFLAAEADSRDLTVLSLR